MNTKILLLKGFVNGNYNEIEFMPQELATALEIAKDWDKRGWQPLLYERQYNGNFVCHYGKFGDLKKLKTYIMPFSAKKKAA